MHVICYHLIKSLHPFMYLSLKPYLLNLKLNCYLQVRGLKEISELNLQMLESQSHVFLVSTCLHSTSQGYEAIHHD